MAVASTFEEFEAVKYLKLYRCVNLLFSFDLLHLFEVSVDECSNVGGEKISKMNRKLSKK